MSLERLLAAAAILCAVSVSSQAGEPLQLNLRSRTLDAKGVVEKQAKWDAGKTALIIDGDALNVGFARASSNLGGLNLIPAVGANVFEPTASPRR